MFRLPFQRAAAAFSSKASSSATNGAVFSVACRAFSADAGKVLVPVISLQGAVGADASEEAMRHVAEELGDACEHSGFLTIVDHGISQKLLGDMWDVTRQFFDLPAEAKEEYTSKDLDKDPYGYVGFGKEILAAGRSEEKGEANVTAPDLKECFNIGPYNPAAGMPPIVYPSHPPELQEVWHKYYCALEQLAADLLRIMTYSLDLPQDWFEDKIDAHRSALRALNYPDYDGEVLPNQIRASAHTDYGTVTILKPDNAPGGVQVLAKDGQWYDVPYHPGAFVVNLGDLMSRWTNDKWVSTMHRVVNPPREASGSCRRQSVAFFHNLNADAMVECIPSCTSADNPPKYPPIRAFDFLMQKHKASISK